MLLITKQFDNKSVILYMKTLLINLFLGLATVVICLLSACTSVYYMPNVQNVPLHTEKDQVSLNASLRTGLEVGSFDIQALYDFEDDFAAMINGQFARSAQQNSQGENSGNGNLVEFGLGYFYELLKKRVVFETYVGAGLGTVTNRYDNDALSKVGLRKTFLQPQIGFKTRDFDFIIRNRFTLLNFGGSSVSGMIPEDEIDSFQFVMNSMSSLMIEQGFTMRIGHDPLKLQFQLVRARSVRNLELHQENFIISA